MDWVIRQIDPAEAALILPLLEQVQSLHAPAHPEIFRAEVDRDELLALLRRMLEQDGMTGLAAIGPEGMAVGYALYEVQSDEFSTLAPAQRRGVLHHVSVGRDWRHRGIGLALVDEVKVRLRAQDVRRLQTSYGAFNEPSAGLMRKAGLRPLHIVAEGDI